MPDHRVERVKRLARFTRKEARAFRAVDDIDPNRLRMFAGILLEFNSAEEALDDILAVLIAVDGVISYDVISRINGMDGKVEIIKQACRASLTLSGDPDKSISLVLDQFLKCKGYRDALAHARPHNETDSIVFTQMKHGKFYEADLSLATLTAVYEHMYHLTIEMASAYSLAEKHWTQFDLESRGSDANEIRHAPQFQAAYARLQESLNQRKTLPAIPEFPEVPPDPPASEERGR